MTVTAILAPVAREPAIELAHHSRIFRKEVLRCGEIDYKGRRIEFTPDYLDALVTAHRDKAFDAVPLVFAGPDNAHTQDVTRIRGQILGFERDGDRLIGVVQAANDEAATLLRENPHIGCSVRIEQPIERADGKRWPAAIQHVLVTANPRITGMSPWQAVEMAADTTPVLDLSLFDFADGEDPSEDKEIEMADQPSPFTDEEITRLRAILDIANQPVDDPDDDGYQMPSDEELAAIAEAALDEHTDEREPVTAGAELSAEAAEAIELANSRVDAMSLELAALRAERDSARYERERDELAERYGIPPRITDLAKPLLCGNPVVELANGGHVDAAEIIRTVLKAVGEQVKMVDLSGPTVFEGSSEVDADRAAAELETSTADYITRFGLR